MTSDLYYCPTTGEHELAPPNGGFDVCCDHPELHEPARPDFIRDLLLNMEQPDE